MRLPSTGTASPSVGRTRSDRRTLSHPRVIPSGERSAAVPDRHPARHPAARQGASARAADAEPSVGDHSSRTRRRRGRQSTQRAVPEPRLTSRPGLWSGRRSGLPAIAARPATPPQSGSFGVSRETVQGSGPSSADLTPTTIRHPRHPWGTRHQTSASPVPRETLPPVTPRNGRGSRPPATARAEHPLPHATTPSAERTRRPLRRPSLSSP